MTATLSARACPRHVHDTSRLVRRRRLRGARRTVASIDHEVNTGALDELFEQLSECCERIKRLQQDALSASFSAAASPRAPATAGPSSAAAASSSIPAEESEEEDAGLDFSGLPSQGPAYFHERKHGSYRDMVRQSCDIVSDKSGARIGSETEGSQN
mmetsp:Transcript_10354/g.32809  ORF Transcript_10354/g.32809 Transcript_10354/m.32809 type:complete len:157 (-) Transcript_10354:42-512(-)